MKHFRKGRGKERQKEALKERRRKGGIKGNKEVLKEDTLLPLCVSVGAAAVC